jgi:hypothetical protein
MLIYYFQVRNKGLILFSYTSTLPSSHLKKGTFHTCVLRQVDCKSTEFRHEEKQKKYIHFKCNIQSAASSLPFSYGNCHMKQVASLPHTVYTFEESTI